MGKLKLTKTKHKEIEKYLTNRFEYLRELRQPLDVEILEEVEMFNNLDRDIRGKEDWEEKYENPYIYTITNTIVARIQLQLFGQSNYIKVFVEHPEFQDLEKEISQWLQEELDKIKLKSRSRDFIEEALTKRVSWLQLRPVNNPKKKGKLKIEFDVLDWFDVWFDTKARQVMDTDFFIKKRKKLYEIKGNPIYFNTEELSRFDGDDDDHAKVKDEYSAKHSNPGSTPIYQEFEMQNNATDEVEILEYYGVYDFSKQNISDKDYKPDIKEVIFTWANRDKLIRAETNDIPTTRKRLMFPMRPLRQSNSLIGKGIPQLTKGMAHENNEARSLRMQNFKSLIKLLFKYDTNAGINLKEVFNGPGNAIGYDGIMNKDGIDQFEQPNVVREASLMIQEGVQEMQQTTGAVDHVMGTNSGAGVSDTASGTRTITEQAMFKFSMMADNIYDDLLEFINFVAILFIHNAQEEIEMRHPKLIKFTNSAMITPENLEESYVFDIEMRDLSQRRDLERHQWANMMGIIGPMVAENGGNSQELLRQFMNVFQIPNQDLILQEESPQAVASKLLRDEQLLAQVQQIVQQAKLAEEQEKGGKNKGSTQKVPPGGGPEEQAGNENIPTG